MRIGIIAEGPGDLAVITNILKGWLNLDSEHIQFLRPEYNQDETDLHAQPETRFSNWEIVKGECLSYSRIDEFLTSPLDEERLVVIHIDAAECERSNYGVSRPKTQPGAEHAEELRDRIAAKLGEWLGGRDDKRLRYAIAVEETDAWLLTLDWRKETSTSRDPKKALQQELHRSNRFSAKDLKRLFQQAAFHQYDELSKPLRKRKSLQDCQRWNKSLQLFLESLP
jgi:hypothetical protein